MINSNNWLHKFIAFLKVLESHSIGPLEMEQTLAEAEVDYSGNSNILDVLLLAKGAETVDSMQSLHYQLKIFRKSEKSKKWKKNFNFKTLET